MKEVEPALQQARRQEKDDLLPPHSGRSGAWEGGQGADPLRKHWPQARLGWLQLFLAQTNSLGNKSLIPHVFYLANNGVRAVGLNPFFLFNLAPSFSLLLKKKKKKSLNQDIVQMLLLLKASLRKQWCSQQNSSDPSVCTALSCV